MIFKLLWHLMLLCILIASLIVTVIGCLFVIRVALQFWWNFDYVEYLKEKYEKKENM